MAVVDAARQANRRPTVELSRRVVPTARLPASAGQVGLIPLALALSLVAVGGKLALLPFPVSTVSEFVRWLLRLAIVVAPDLCFITGLTAACLVVSACLRRWPRAAALAWRPACRLGYGLAALYAVASVPMYKVTMVPFSLRLLSFAGGPDVMASSVRPFLPPGMVAALVISPLAVMLAPWAVRRWPWFRDGAPVGVRAQAAVLLAMAVYGIVCRHYVQSHWTDPNRWERRIAQSPHGVLLLSCVEELLKERPFTHTFSFDQTDESDFRRRPPQPAGAPGADLPPAVAGSRPKNILLVVMESTGVEYFGVHGSKHPTTPRLNELAARRGVVFENIYVQAASSCKSLVALSASVYPRPDWLLIVRDHPDFSVPTIAEVLGERGYRTCYAHSGYWSWQGRDRFLKARGVDKIIGADDRPDQQVNSWGIRDETMYQEVLDWIDEGAGRPFFAFAYTIETHHPYVAPEVHHDFGVDDEELARYLNAVRAADAKIAWLVGELERRGLADSTVVAITSDHGESFGQHNQRVHSFGVYEQTVHVPLVLLHPGLRGLSRKNGAVGQHIDIAPTLLDLVGVPAPAAWQGQSLFRQPEPRRAYFFSVGNEVVLGLRDGRFKYHFYVDTQREELFDLEADPAELDNLAAGQPGRCAAYRRRVGGLVQFQRAYLAHYGVE